MALRDLALMAVGRDWVPAPAGFDVKAGREDLLDAGA
jgi:hypothetical protein